MISSSALEFVAAVPQRPVQCQVGLTTLPVFGITANRVDNLRCLLLQRDLMEQPRDQSCFTLPVILGQWRN
jgi:hypothetical protein